MNLTQKLQKYRRVYNDFDKFCYIVCFKKDMNTFNKFKLTSEDVKIKYIIKYLEEVHNIDFLDAISYYSYIDNKQGYDYKVRKAIFNEFQRIEQEKEKPSYLPF